MIETPVPDDWIPRLAGTIAAAVREFAASLDGTPAVLLAVDCHPWHGSIELAVLTAGEVHADGLLADPSEMAAWRHYEFSAGLASWQPAAVLGGSMRAAYEAAADRRAAADAFFRACTKRPPVRRSPRRWRRWSGRADSGSACRIRTTAESSSRR